MIRPAQTMARRARVDRSWALWSAPTSRRFNAGRLVGQPGRVQRPMPVRGPHVVEFDGDKSPRHSGDKVTALQNARRHIVISPMEKLFEVIHEDDALLVVHKPAGLACHPTKGDAYSSLISRVRLHLAGRGEPQLINRLDRETSGVVLVAKDATFARLRRRRRESREVEHVSLASGHRNVAHGDAG